MKRVRITIVVSMLMSIGCIPVRAAQQEQQEQEERKEAGIGVVGDEQLAHAIALEQEQEAADQEQPVPKKNKRVVIPRETQLRDYFSGVMNGGLSPLAPLMADYAMADNIIDNPWLDRTAEIEWQELNEDEGEDDPIIEQELDEDKDDDRMIGIVISPDSRFIVMRSGALVKVWRNDGTLLHTFTLVNHGSRMVVREPIAISPDSKRIVTGSPNGIVEIWSIEGKLLHTLRGHTGVVSAVAISPDGTFIATRSFDEATQIWSMEGELLHTMEDPSSGGGEGDQLVISADSRLIITTSEDDNMVRIWSREGQLLHIFNANADALGAVYNIQISSDGTFIVTGCANGIIKIWDMDGKLLHVFTVADNKKGPLTWVAISPDSSYIVTATLLGEMVKIWDRNGVLLHTLAARGYKSPVRSVAISSDGQIIAIRFNNNKTEIWSRDGVLLRTLPIYNKGEAAISPDIKFIVTGSPDKALIWRVVQQNPDISVREQEDTKIARGGEIESEEDDMPPLEDVEDE